MQITYCTNIPCMLLSYSMHIPYIFQASEPGTVFHVIPSAPPSPRAHSLPLSHVAFACTSRVATCSDLGQDGRQRLILTFLAPSRCARTVHKAVSMGTANLRKSWTYHANVAEWIIDCSGFCGSYSFGVAACSSRVVPRVEFFFLACSRFAILSDKSSFAGHIGQLATIPRCYII